MNSPAANPMLPAAPGTPAGGPLPRGPGGGGPGMGPGPGIGPTNFWTQLQEAGYFLRFVRPVRWLLVLIVLSSLASYVLLLPVMFAPQQLTRHFDDKPHLWKFLVLMTVATIASGLLSLVEGYCSNRMGEYLARVMRLEIFSKLERANMGAIVARGAGQFVQRIVRDVEQIRDLYRMTLTQLLTQVIRVSVLVVAMLWMEPVLTLILVGVFLVVGPFIRRLNRRVEEQARRIQQLNEENIDQMVEAVGGFRDIQVSGRFDRFYQRFERVARDTEETCVRAGRYAHQAGTIPTVVSGILTVVPYFLAVRRLDTVAGIGEVVSYVGMLGQTLSVLTMMTRSTSLLARATPSIREVRRLLDPLPGAGPAAGPGPGPVPPPRIDTLHATVELPVRSIRFDNVGIQLGGRWVLRNMNFEIPGGKFTAIVGQSGAGKTTIFMMLVKLMEPTEGRILVNDCPLNDISLAQLRRLVGYIPQNPFIFNQSLRDNLLMAAVDEHNIDSVLAQAVVTARLGEVVRSREAEGGLEAMAGHMGARLSGGERQRIALGRLLIQDPQVVVCDEYTANIDVKSARIIDRTVHECFSDRTRIVITHSLYTISNADHIVVVDQGTVLETGTHRDLSTKPGLYRELWEMQAVGS
ncbi:MAG: ABC transporter ATP-binding protein [Planctomycetaceae bacterium]|nr:ABC transporter ATP-binding protein [Planctomycetaceae bacterium]